MIKHHNVPLELNVYLEGAVYEGFVQVDHHTVLAIVYDTDLRQEELGWRLQRQHTTFRIYIYICTVLHVQRFIRENRLILCVICI